MEMGRIDDPALLRVDMSVSAVESRTRMMLRGSTLSFSRPCLVPCSLRSNDSEGRAISVIPCPTNLSQDRMM